MGLEGAVVEIGKHGPTQAMLKGGACRTVRGLGHGGQLTTSLKAKSFMQAFDEVLRRLGSEYTYGYGPTPIPSLIDEEVAQLLNSLLAFVPEQRGLFLEQMTEAYGFVFLAYAERMASQIIREQQPRVLREAMTAIAIAIQLVDVRDVLPVISLLSHSTEELGLEPLQQMRFASSLKNKTLDEYVDEFAARSADARRIEAMGYVKGQDSDGFRYFRT